MVNENRKYNEKVFIVRYTDEFMTNVIEGVFSSRELSNEFIAQQKDGELASQNGEWHTVAMTIDDYFTQYKESV